MNAHTPTSPGFKRQVVVRLDAEQWTLLEAAVAKHGSMQAAILAGLQALNRQPDTDSLRVKPEKNRQATRSRRKPSRKAPEGDEEIPAREAARLLGVKPDTVRGYIRTGRLPGRHDGEPTWLGWLTTRRAVEEYGKARS